MIEALVLQSKAVDYLYNVKGVDEEQFNYSIAKLNLG